MPALEARGPPDTGVGEAQDHPKSPCNYPRQGLELGLMEQPNQEEVRGQGSEVVHFIDQVFSMSHSRPAKPDPALCGHPIHRPGGGPGMWLLNIQGPWNSRVEWGGGLPASGESGRG